MYDIIELNQMLVNDLREIAKELQVKKPEKLKKQELVYKILDTQAILASEGKLKQTKLVLPKTQPEIQQDNSKQDKDEDDDEDDDSLSRRKRIRILRTTDEKVKIVTRENKSHQPEKTNEPVKEVKSESKPELKFDDPKPPVERNEKPFFKPRQEKEVQQKNFFEKKPYGDREVKPKNQLTFREKQSDRKPDFSNDRQPERIQQNVASLLKKLPKLRLKGETKTSSRTIVTLKRDMTGHKTGRLIQEMSIQMLSRITGNLNNRKKPFSILKG